MVGSLKVPPLFVGNLQSPVYSVCPENKVLAKEVRRKEMRKEEYLLG